MEESIAQGVHGRPAFESSRPNSTATFVQRGKLGAACVVGPRGKPVVKP